MTVHERPACSPVEGTLMRIFIDDSQPTQSPEHRWTETTWEGKGKLFKGELDIYCDGIWRRVTPSDGVLVVKRCTVHGFSGVPGVRMVLREACQPDGDYKEAFFRDMGQQDPPSFWLVMRVFSDWDTQPSLGRWSPLWLDMMFITVLGGIAKFVAPPKAMEAELIKD